MKGPSYSLTKSTHTPRADVSRNGSTTGSDSIQFGPRSNRTSTKEGGDKVSQCEPICAASPFQTRRSTDAVSVK